MAAELPRPGIEIIQELTSAAPTILIPTLVPFVCGPAKEIVLVNNSDGTLNPAAKQGSYTQLPVIISQTSFPSPRSNIAEVVVEEDSIRVFSLFGGSLHELIRDTGESFLVAVNDATRPGVRTKTFDPVGGLALNTKILVLAVDVPARLNTTEDVVVTFAGTGSLVIADIVSQINAAVGDTVASAISIGAVSRVAITSNKYGAAASITVRAGGSANSVLGFAVDQETRIEGSGFRAQDQSNNTTLSPWIEWTKGGYLLDGVAQSSLPSYSDVIGSPTTTVGFGFTDNTGTFNASFLDSSMTFLSSGLNLKVGDEFVADGSQPNSAFIMKVESTRFKLGTLDVKLSTFDANGKAIAPVYDVSSVGTLFADNPFAPRYAWFQARNLLPNTSAVKATALGSTEGTPATTATISSPAVPAGSSPYPLTGLTLKFDVTVDGTAIDTQTFTFTGSSFADLASIITAVGAGGLIGLFAHTDTGGTKIAFSTDKTGARQSLVLRSDSTALVALGFVAVTEYDATGTDVSFLDVPATLVSTAVSLSNIATKTLVIKLSGDSDQFSPTFPTSKTHTFGAGPFANIAAVVADIAADATFLALDGTTGTGLAVSSSGTSVVIKSSVGGSTKGIQFDATTSTIDNATAGFTFLTTSDVGEENLSGQTLKFSINNRPKVYSVLFVSDSLVDAVANINEVVGWPVASIGGTNADQLLLTSDLAGYASSIQIITDTWTSGTAPSSRKAAAALGYNVAGQTTAGSGRPNPDFQVDVSGNIVLGAEILRNSLTGQPFDPGSSDLYVQYRGLRLDVSPLAKSPALLQIGDTATLTTVLSPINTDNPLGLGMFFCMISAPGIQISGLGVDDASDPAGQGTLLAYTRVASMIEAFEIYAIAPLTHDEGVAQMFNSHVQFMAGAEQKGERILFFNPLVPTRNVDDEVGSGISGNTTAGQNEFTTDINVIPGLVTRGLNPAELEVTDNVFLQVTVAGEIRNYSISEVNGVVLVLNTTFSSTQNKDAFFTTTPLTTALTNAAWSVNVRGTALLIPGSTLPDKDAIAQTVQNKAGAYKQRRLYYVFPDTVQASINGVDQLIPAYYACAAIAGLVGAQPPQQGFTNFAMTGFSAVIGSQDTFSNSQLNVMAGGGAYILVQDAQGAPIISRMQLSTDLTSIETRELSITKVVDFTAKFLRTGLRRFIGTFNITTSFLDTLSTVIQGMLSFLTENGVLISADLNNLIQSKDQPDTVLVDISVSVPFPANYIRLTIAV